ncbi:MAG: PKD domain-containing protein, partial [Candidatus Bipolaricaulota bacterium]
MSTTCRRILALVGLAVGFASLAAAALPGFSDRNIAAGNLNPTDTIKVQEIRVTRGASETVTLASITVQNLGTAGDGDIDKITVMDGGDELGTTTNIAGLSTGVTINLGGFAMTGTTHDLKIFVTVGTAVNGGETVNLRCRIHYVRNGESGTSAWISDLTGEILRKGGFDALEDSSPDAAYLNPLDEQIVQIAVFTDDDANGSAVAWTQAVGTDVIVEVENLGTALPADIDEVNVTITVAGNEYTSGWRNWAPASPMGFQYGWFLRDDNGDGDALDGGTEGQALPATVADNAGATVTTLFRIDDADSVTDGRTIRTRTTVFVTETGEGADGEAVDYEQSVDSETTQTIRKQGFERIEEESETLSSGTAATGDVVVQTVRAYDDDSNANGVNTRRVYIRNMGSADGDEIEKIEVKAGATTLVTLTGNELDDFKTGDWHDLDPAGLAFVVDDDEDQDFKIYYTIGVPVDGHTLKPAFRIEGREPAGGVAYPSDQVTYPDALGLYEPGFEFVENQTPPEGGVAYSGQRLLAQTIRLEDRDQDADNVTIHPVVVKNLGTASGNPDVTKIEIWRRDTLDGTALKLGETTDLTGFRTGGARVEMTHDNVVTDRAGGAETYLDVYLTIAEPEDMVANRTIQLETRVLHTEKESSFDKLALSNQWTLETNHRPVPTIGVAAVAPASATPKADFTYEQTIQFTGAATDADGDAITSWRWDFGDGATSTQQSPTHRYPNGGTFTVTLTVTDARGVTGTATKTITVQGPPNVVPTATFTWTPEAPAENQTVTFTSTVTDSDQPAGTPHTYDWDFGDGTAKSALPNPTHQFAEKKTYTVKLTVTDAQNATVTVEHTVSVGNTPPVVGNLAATPAAPSTGEDVQFTAQNVTDAD